MAGLPDSRAVGHRESRLALVVVVSSLASAVAPRLVAAVPSERSQVVFEDHPLKLRVRAIPFILMRDRAHTGVALSAFR
jgi:hypothetical protein